MAQKPPAPIPVFSFVDDQGVRYQIEGRDDVRAFVQEEESFWAGVTHSLLDQSWVSMLQEWISIGLTALETGHPYERPAESGVMRAGDRLVSVADLESQNEFRRVIFQYQLGMRPTRTSAFATELNETKRIDNDARRLGLIRKIVADFLLANSDMNFKETVKDARELSAVLDEAIVAAKAENEAMRGTLSRVSAQIQEAKLFSDHADRQVEAAGQLLKNFPIRLANECTSAANNAAAQAANTILADKELREPQGFWEGREAGHKRSRGTFLVLFFALCLSAAALISGLAYLLFEPRIGEAHESWTIAFALLGAPGLLAVWVIRMVGKIYTTHQALETDAAERVTMMKAFLALNASNKLTPDDKHLILKALFRPSHQVVEEEPMPSWIDAVFSRVGTQNK